MTTRANSEVVAPELLRRLAASLPLAADSDRAVSMAAYMRDQFPFWGVPSPALKLLVREASVGLPKPTEADLRLLARECWALPQREYQYVASGYLRRHAKLCGPGFIATARDLITTKSWWDTVDELAVHLVGPLVSAHPELVSTMDEWLAGDELWLTRTAILHQNMYKQHTDPDRLFRYCRDRAGHPDFFIRKAIGWALREYAYTDAQAVRDFVKANSTALSGLSQREALKNVGA